MKRYVFIIFVIFLFFSCEIVTGDKVAKMMDGTWKNKFEPGSSNAEDKSGDVKEPGGDLTITNSYESGNTVWTTVYSDGSKQIRKGNFFVYTSNMKKIDKKKKFIAVFTFVEVKGNISNVITEEYYVVFKKDKDKICMYLKETSIVKDKYNKFVKG